ncbi:MAG: DUF1772 domain-containing protein [Actinomycetota bacterium]|nr:DUF1772 domain-containing protein [Actinomycetota bacterium]
MILKVARFVNLILAALLAGNEFGSWVAVHPALGRLSAAERIRAEQEVTRRFAAIMPFWMSSVIASCMAVLALIRDRRSPAFRSTLAGTACFVAMLLSTLFGNVPINNRVLKLSPETDAEEFSRLRERWDRLHTLRVFLNVAGLGLLYLGAFSKVPKS